MFYDRRFDSMSQSNSHYQLKIGFLSPHTLCLERIKRDSYVLDLGCGGGHVSGLLRDRLGCRTTGIDLFPPEKEDNLDTFIRYDLNNGLPDMEIANYDYILLLDVLEHFTPPEELIDSLKKATSMCPAIRLLISTANIGFFINRLMLLFGQFNYGKRGILDISHWRLFTFGSLKRLLEQSGFAVEEIRGIPAPYPLALGDNILSRFLLWANSLLIRVSKRLFSYQIFMVARPLPSMEYLLLRAQEQSAIRTKNLSNNFKVSVLG